MNQLWVFTIQDVYDADMWKTFLFSPLDNTEAFLSDPKTFAQH